MKFQFMIITLIFSMTQALASTNTVIIEKVIDLNEKESFEYPYSIRLGFVEGRQPIELEDEGSMVIDGCTLIIRSFEKRILANAFIVTEVKKTRPNPFDLGDNSRWGKIIFSENKPGEIQTQADIKCFADTSFRLGNPFSNEKMSDILYGYVILD